MEFRERMREQNRLQVLRLLAEDPEDACNLFVLRDALEDMGRRVTVTGMAGMADWLAAEGLVRQVSRETPPVVRITPRGIRVVRGRTAVKGVAQPLP